MDAVNDVSFARHFAVLPDPRIDHTRKHTLGDILAIIPCATIAAGVGDQDGHPEGVLDADPVDGDLAVRAVPDLDPDQVGFQGVAQALGRQEMGIGLVNEAGYDRGSLLLIPREDDPAR